MVRFLSIIFAIVPVLAVSYADYDNDFVDPSYILSKDFASTTAEAQQSIVQWADRLGSQGPWSVINKTVLPPTGNKQDYLSWAPYSWPNCSNVDNTTELTPPQMWAQCNYDYRDGQFNPDRLLVNNTGQFQAMSDAVFYNTLAWVLTGKSNYSANAAHFLDTWFLDPTTGMTPNLQYAQMNRGPTGQVGTHTGALDLKAMAKITSAILILRGGNSPDWTIVLDTQMSNWTTHYVDWLTTSPIAYLEWTATNNHGTYFYNQLSSLYILLNDTTAAKNSTQFYFDGLYQTQINSTGDQPREAARTHPYHYRCYNLAAMIVNAKIGKYLGLNMWNKTSAAGTTIKDALDMAMSVTLNATDGDGPIWELYPAIAAVGAAYGDPDNKYASFLANADNQYPAQPYFLFNQNFSDSGLSATSGPTASASGDRLSISSLGAGYYAVILLVTAALSL
ncbi:chondroitin AC/alginate lyase [Athelia psychrophila]|uniref:Chondroitin AC/alginate lyase n=1 Tax=Athelia psychrophila TaxID=1759441 RepID=A0A166EK75_9AGAM|nr:chondroitin AC/alginate lyase [Fibularhizoctonia sp. CBS 109695]